MRRGGGGANRSRSRSGAGRIAAPRHMPLSCIVHFISIHAAVVRSPIGSGHGTHLGQHQHSHCLHPLLSASSIKGSTYIYLSSDALPLCACVPSAGAAGRREYFQAFLPVYLPRTLEIYWAPTSQRSKKDALAFALFPPPGRWRFEPRLLKVSRIFCVKGRSKGRVARARAP